MSIASSVGLIWAAFWIYWLASAMSAKRNLGTAARSHAGVRVVIFLAAALLIRATISLFPPASTQPIIISQWIGLGAQIIGLAYAVWARIHIGRNWGMPMSRKDQPELITTGPYRLVRHPIYTGIIVAGLGTTLVFGPVWLIAVIAAAAYFYYSAVTEERMLTREFGKSYEDYRKRSKMFFPYLI